VRASLSQGAGELLCSIAMLAVLRSWMGPSTPQAPTIVEGSADAAIVRALEATTPNPIITISQLARVLRRHRDRQHAHVHVRQHRLLDAVRLPLFVQVRQQQPP
jgi:hypothetical protein